MEMTSRQLPDDIIIEIFTRLPAKSLLRFRCVSKSWNNFISDTNFIDMHLKFNQTIANDNGYVLVHYPATGCPGDKQKFSLHSDDETYIELMKLELPFATSSNNFHVEGYCNGLVCLSCAYKANRVMCDIYLWNPAIHKFKALPKSLVPFGGAYDKAVMSVSFGFVPQINDYKVIKFVEFNGLGLVKVPPEVHIYSLRLNSWKEIENIVPFKIYFNTNDPIVNGVVHWVATCKKVGGYNDGKFILTFDMANDIFGEMMLPECCHDECIQAKSIMVLKESLSLFLSYREGKNYRVDIWVMKEYGAAESWTKLFTFNQWVCVSPLGFLKNGAVVFRRDYYDDVLVSYDATINLVKYLQTNSVTKPLDAFTYYMESLVLLDEGN